MTPFVKELVHHFKRFYDLGLPYGLTDSQVDRLYNHQDDLVAWLISQMSNYQTYGSISTGQLMHLEESFWPPLIDFAAECFQKDSNNAPAEIVLFEAKRFGYLPSKYHDLETKGYSQRQLDQSVKTAWAISFEINGPHHKNPNHLVRDGYHRYEDWEKSAGFDDGIDIPNKDKSGHWNWDLSVDIQEDDKRTFHHDSDGVIVQHEFGGYISGLEAKGINRLLTLNPIPPHLPITGLSQLTLGMDFDKVFQMPIQKDLPAYYQHDIDGIPYIALTDINRSEIDYYRCAPIRRGKVLLYELPKKYLQHDEGNNWRIGGSPQWWQKPEVPTCYKCGQPMAFLANLPSGNMRTIDNGFAYYGSDGGTAYAWWCDQDKISCYTWQDT